MKKFNLIYIIAILVGLVLWKISGNFQKQSLVFYGFAETKETEINSEFPVEVNKLHVTTGQKVAAGDVLAEVMQADFPKKQAEANFKIEELESERELQESNIRGKISELKAQKSVQIGEINSKISELKAKAEQNRRLLKDVAEQGSEKGITDIRIESLERERSLIEKPIDAEIAALRKQLKKIRKPQEARIRSLESEISFYNDKTNRLQIMAPSDGLIGNIHIKEAEFVPSFNTLITFYEENPTLVQGFVHESMILKVAVGDTLEVISSLHPDAFCSGVVTGLGSRIIEIPQRLRKMPEIKTYGREVLIKIPRDNTFLQKEKVTLKITANADNSSFGIMDILSGNSRTSSRQSRTAQATKQ